MKQEIYFTSDTHFGHKGILNFCNRPWNNTVDMDIRLIDLWNQTVGPNDIVWHLGDVSWHNERSTNEMIMNQLHGEKHLILGNHDPKHVQTMDCWASVQDYKDLRIGNDFVTLFHYPIRDWRGRFHGSYHLYGHVHDRYHPPIGHRAMDVGVDPNDYRPLKWETIKDKLKYGWSDKEKTGWQGDEYSSVTKDSQ